MIQPISKFSSLENMNCFSRNMMIFFFKLKVNLFLIMINCSGNMDIFFFTNHGTF